MDIKNPPNRISSYYEYEEEAMHGRRGGGMHSLWRHVVELGELQTRLLFADLREVKSRIQWPVIALAVGLVLALSAGPVLVTSLGMLLEMVLEWSLAASLLLSACVFLILGLGLAYTGVTTLLSAGEPLRRSEEELRNNLNALANAVRHATGGEEQASHESKAAR